MTWIVVRRDLPAVDPKDVEPDSLGRPQLVRQRLEENFPGIEWRSSADASWSSTDVTLHFTLPDADSPLRVDVHGVSAEREKKVAAAFRRLYRRSLWCVFDATNGSRIEFPAAPRQRDKRKKLTALAPQELPTGTSLRRIVYVELRPAEDVVDLFDLLNPSLKASAAEHWAMVEERARIVFADGTVLQGLSFKREHPAVADALAALSRIVVEALPEGRFVAVSGTVPAEFTAWEY